MWNRGSARVLVAAVVVAMLCLAPPAGAQPALRPVRVHVASAYDPLQPVTIAFPAPGGLPRGGYYYAVAVLGTGRAATPACAVSSDMSRVPYGYPRHGRWVALTLQPASDEDWCAGASYSAAVYAVPHPPRCDRKSGCAADYGCELSAGQCPPINGVVPFVGPRKLPKPIDRTARIVARFRLGFPAGPPSVPDEALPGLLAHALEAGRANGDPRPTQIEAVRTTIGGWERLNGSGGSSPLDAEPIYLVVERGNFVCNTCHVPHGAGGTQHAGVIALQVPIAGGVSGFALPTRYPDLGLLGDPVSLGP